MQHDLHYATCGEGDVDILLLHGWASSSQMWQTLIAHCDLPVRWWAVDLLGFGQSVPPEDEPLTIDDHMRSVIHFIEAHKIKAQVVIAHSTGGMIALKLAFIRPDLLQQLVLISPVVTGQFSVGGLFSRIMRTAPGATVARSVPALLAFIQNSGIAEHFTDVVGIGEIANAVKQQMIADFQAMHPRSCVETLISLAQENMLPFLFDIDHPTLIFVGERDLTVPSSEGKTAALYLPHAELHSLPDSYHHPHEEHTAECVAIMCQFLERYGLS